MGLDTLASLAVAAITYPAAACVAVYTGACVLIAAVIAL